LPDRTETISATWKLVETEPQEAAAKIHSDQKTLGLYGQQPHPVPPHQIIHKIIDLLVLPLCAKQPNHVTVGAAATHQGLPQIAEMKSCDSKVPQDVGSRNARDRNWVKT